MVVGLIFDGQVACGTHERAVVAPEPVDVSMRSQDDAPSSAACASPSHDGGAVLSRLVATLPIPLRPPHSQQRSVFLPQEIGWLDALLLSWGYYDDPKAFVRDFEQDYEQVRRNPAARATWIRGKVAWLAHGDLILDTIEKFLADGGCTTWGADEVARIWAGLTQVVFKVQWVMTAAEVRLGGMQVGLPFGGA
ncbi:hypothetical protein A0H81_05656 [Grifola frondosa]|uniref:Uncharacterized protein n=1 Tax=Grifola frondosa TaxID=5627 RepID=A0A1C7MCQ7_GRIFR|nr:hypothetical protein A0H81_05656 [Grifola frondosa]